MELLQLQYFQKVAKLESISKAANELHIAQPSLSKTISRLEEQLGAKLFDRNGKRIRLNETGKVFLSHVEKSLQELEDGIKEVRDSVEQQDTQVIVGTATAKLLPNLVCDYLTENPSIRFRLLQVINHEELWIKLQQNEIDICISSLPLHGKGICCRPLTDEKIYLVVSKNHRFADKTEIHLAETEKEPLIYYTAESGLREIISKFYQKAACTPHVTCECTTPEVTCSLIEAGIGIAFLPECLLDVEYARKLVWIPVTAPEFKRTIWISWNKERYLSKAVVRFKEFVFQYFKSLP